MRSRTRNRTAILSPLVVLATATGSFFAGGPADRAQARACLRLESRSAFLGSPGCARLVELRNSCNVHVVAEVRTTQVLFSGSLSQSFPVVVPAGGAQSLGCAWWSGAMAPTRHELVGARFLGGPGRPHGTRAHHGTDRR